MRRLFAALQHALFALSCLAAGGALAGPVDVALQPSPQEFTNTCQSYSIGLAMSFTPASPFKADTPLELRDLEERLRKEIEASAKGKEPTHADWKVAIEKVTSNKLTLVTRSFKNLDPALRFAADSTGIGKAKTLGTPLSIAMVKTPVLISFLRIGTSNYASGHVVTVFGAELPPQSIGDAAHPELLFVNSAVKYKDNVKNVCSATDLSDKDRYTALLTLTADYQMKTFGGAAPYLVHFVQSK